MYTLYTRKGCTLCEISKNYLTEIHEPFTIVEIDVDITRDEVLEKFPDVKMLPVVTYEGRFIGGKDQLYEHVKARQDVEKEDIK